VKKKINKKSCIYVTGHKGLVGSSIVRRLKYYGYKNILTVTRGTLDLRDQKKVNFFFKKNKPEVVINAAATVGGIEANNKYRAEFIYNNLAIQTNIINACYEYKIKQLIFLGSSCVYPRDCKQPIKEEYLLSGTLEKSNEPYAIAKIAGIKMCESYNLQYNTNFKCLMPCNTYGPNDNYDSKTSHFYPALIKKIYEAKLKKQNTITIWGTGKVKREIIYVDDLADACIYFFNKNTKETLINVGSGIEKSIIGYAKFIIKELKINLKIKYDKSKLTGTPRKILNSSIARKYGWKPKVNLKSGFKKVFNGFK
jgi:GDP-L-fucose synthase|tara:strand:+ start:4502 stop:5431 length:930 start_codon:yes stop_codon:yes gene_type:complete